MKSSSKKIDSKKNIAVIFGGRSAEHDVSIITAHTPIIDSLEVTGNYDVWPVYISKEGHWYSNKDMNDISYFRDGDIGHKLKREKKISLKFDDGLQIIWSGLRDKKINIDIVFPAMHGTYGEDGSLMGILRMANIPFVGCDLSSSAVAMDKVFTKQVLESEDVPVVPYVWLTKSEWLENKTDDYMKDIKAMNWPLFVKPAHLGSSIAITKVKNDKELDNALEVAFHYDNKVLVEESVEDLIEVTLPIIGYGENLQLALIERPLNKTEFFDFEDKYLGNGKKGGGGVNSQYSELPANIDENLSREVKNLSKKTYRILGCSGIARVDLLIDKNTNKVYVNEVNTLPGSLYHHNWKKSGMSGIDLVNKLIELAEERHYQSKDINYVFDSDILRK